MLSSLCRKGNNMKFIYDVEKVVGDFGMVLSTSLSDLTYDMIEVVASYSSFNTGAMSLEDIVESLRAESVLDGDDEKEDRDVIEDELLSLYRSFDGLAQSDIETFKDKVWTSALSDDETTLIIKVQ